MNELTANSNELISSLIVLGAICRQITQPHREIITNKWYRLSHPKVFTPLYNNSIPASLQPEIVSLSHTETCTSPMWAFSIKSMHSLD